MTTAVLDRPCSASEDATAGERGRGGTLEQRLSEVLRAARTEAGASCPVCHAQMTAAHGGTAACEGCGSRLS
ncbi:MAG TPA: hypothetical protein VFM57_09680 [Thermoleophilaceae bacterium]|nr:hypothetical protein [Thermoleophilaceae bacterium]